MFYSAYAPKSTIRTLNEFYGESHHLDHRSIDRIIAIYEMKIELHFQVPHPPQLPVIDQAVSGEVKDEMTLVRFLHLNHDPVLFASSSLELFRSGLDSGLLI